MGMFKNLRKEGKNLVTKKIRVNQNFDENN